MDALHPSVTLLCKLSSVVVHADEYLSPDGHDVDLVALHSALRDPEVKEWIEQMAASGMAPVKR